MMKMMKMMVPEVSQVMWCVTIVALVVPVTSSGGSSRHFATQKRSEKETFDNSWCFRGLYDIDNCPGMNVD